MPLSGTYEDYRGYVDTYLSRLTPDGLKALRAYQTSGGNTALKDKAVDVLMVQLGMSREQARGLAILSESVYQNPYRKPGDFRDPDGTVAFGGAGGHDKLPDRAAFKSDQEYHDYVLKLYGLESTPTRTPEEEKAAAEADQKLSITQQIDQFINAMKGPVDPSDPVLQGLQKYGQAAAMASLGRAGIGMRGGGAQRQVQSVTQANILPYLQKRQELWQTGLGMQSNRDLGLGQLQQGWTQMQNQQAEMRAAAEQAQKTSQGQMWGGALAAIPAVALAPYTGGASLGLIGAGSAIGGGVAGSNVGAPKYSTGYTGPKGTNPYTGY